MTYSYKNSKGQTYYLHSKKIGKGELFFFAKEEKVNSIENLPTGYMVVENQRTGLPIIKKLMAQQNESK